MNAHLYFPLPDNEVIYSYAPLSPEREKLLEAIQQLKSQPITIPSLISGREVLGKTSEKLCPPHELSHTLATFSPCTGEDVQKAIEGALHARVQWANTPWEVRASIFLKAADLISGKYRFLLNGATMLGQGKNAHQAEIDSACELIDFLRFNVHFLNEIYKQQPKHGAYVYNRLEYRPLEGFVFAVTPFNFTAIGANLATAPALCGNVVIWKPSYTQLYSAWMTMRILREAGLPDGVIQFIVADGKETGDVCLAHSAFAGLHFTGSTSTFNALWKSIGGHVDRYKTYPRIVGETGGKDFVFVHPSADVDVAVTALVRGAYEYQGQKCSAASRAYLPKSLAEKITQGLVEQLKTIKMGSVEDFSNFVNAVIDQKSFDKIVGYLEKVRQDSHDAQIVCGGKYDKTQGYFIEPTLIATTNPLYTTMCEEIFGPVLTYFVYEDADMDKTLDLLNATSAYALTGSVIAQDRYAIEQMTNKLTDAAGNFYINDKPTGAVVGQQPFGGARKSGTNDKAGSMLNLYRWLSPRTVKEISVPSTSYAYPFLRK